jgi:hypothetical protein
MTANAPGDKRDRKLSGSRDIRQNNAQYPFCKNEPVTMNLETGKEWKTEFRPRMKTCCPGETFCSGPRACICTCAAILYSTMVVPSFAANFSYGSQPSLLITPFEQTHSAFDRLLRNQATLDLVSVRWRSNGRDIEDRRRNGCAEELD